LEDCRHYSLRVLQVAGNDNQTLTELRKNTSMKATVPCSILIIHLTKH